MNTVIRTIQQLQQAQADAWIYGFIVTGIALLLAIVISAVINWRSDRRDFITRRIWFIIIGLVLPLSYWVYNMQMIVPRIQNAGFQNMFKATNLYILFSAIGAYFIVGIFTMFISKKGSKWRSILSKKFQ